MYRVFTLYPAAHTMLRLAAISFDIEQLWNVLVKSTAVGCPAAMCDRIAASICKEIIIPDKDPDAPIQIVFASSPASKVEAPIHIGRNPKKLPCLSGCVTNPAQVGGTRRSAARFVVRATEEARAERRAPPACRSSNPVLSRNRISRQHPTLNAQRPTPKDRKTNDE